jgi:hypothetical protein
MYDLIGLTRFAALDRYGYAMSMCRRTDGKFRVGSRNRVNRDSDYGLRQIDFV